MSAAARAELAVIVAMTERRCIGGAGGLLWHVSEDLKRFKALTSGHAIVMGRVTYESIGRPLPGRRNVVITSRDTPIPGCEIAASFDAAIDLARQTDAKPFVIGGARVYEAALASATELFVTWVGAPHLGREHECDTFFPAWDPAAFVEAEREPGATEGVIFSRYVRAAT